MDRDHCAAGAERPVLGTQRHLGLAEQVVGTVAVVTTFLGALLGISTAQYKRECQSCEDESV